MAHNYVPRLGDVEAPQYRETPKNGSLLQTAHKVYGAWESMPKSWRDWIADRFTKNTPDEQSLDAIQIGETPVYDIDAYPENLSINDQFSEAPDTAPADMTMREAWGNTFARRPKLNFYEPDAPAETTAAASAPETKKTETAPETKKAVKDAVAAQLKPTNPYQMSNEELSAERDARILQFFQDKFANLNNEFGNSYDKFGNLIGQKSPVFRMKHEDIDKW